jgi:universal stress protein E
VAPPDGHCAFFIPQPRRDLPPAAGIAHRAVVTGQVMEHPMSRGNSAGNRTSAPDIQWHGLHVVDAPASRATTLQFTRPDFARNSYRVLLAHDLTAASEIALVRAARLAREREGHLTILHVVDSKLPAGVIEARRAQAKSCLEAEARRWLGRGTLSYRIDIGLGDPAGAIAARAQAYDVDLVVTGRHRRIAFAEKFTGGVVTRLLRRVRRPVLVVGNANQSPYRRVLIPIDLTSASAARVQLTAAFVPQASLHLLYACKRGSHRRVAPVASTLGPEEQTGKLPRLTRGRSDLALSSFIESLGLRERRPVAIVGNGDALLGLKQELALQKTDLLVLEARASAGLGQGLRGRGTEAIVRSSPCDVLFSSCIGLPARSIQSPAIVPWPGFPPVEESVGR